MVEMGLLEKDQCGWQHAKYKARLVAKHQVKGIDYEETISPTTMVKSIQIMLVIVAYYDYAIWQMEVKTTFHFIGICKRK